MRTNEIRIGNYLQGRSSFVQVSRIYSEHAVGIGKGDPYYVSGDRPCLHPIPLTEEWLLRFGFELINNDYWQSRNLELKLHWTVNKNKMIPEFCEKRLITGYNFQHVHQLQNLYFALTGEELTLKQ